MKDWLPHQQTFLSELLNMEAPPYDMTCSSCLMQESQVRCLDCLGSPILCHQCCLANHRTNPYHKIEAWKGKCFLASDLHDIGLVLHLGHGGHRCPRASQNQSNSIVEPDMDWDAEEEDEDDEDAEEDIIVVVDTTGVFKRRIRWCHCPQAPSHHIQLLRMRLYPATVKKPGTAFTFSVLDHFYFDSMECKTSANNFFNKLRRLTSNAFPHTVAVCDLISGTA